MKELVLMCGAPGSGKTTIAKKLLCNNDIYISRDEIRYSMITDKDEYFSKENEVFNEYVRQIDEALAKDYHWIIADATQLNFASRNKVLARLKNKPNKIIVIYMKVPLDEVLKRNNQRSGRAKVPDEVVKKMYASMQEPTRDEKIDLLIYSNGNIIWSKNREE